MGPHVVALAGQLVDGPRDDDVELLSGRFILFRGAKFKAIGRLLSDMKLRSLA